MIILSSHFLHGILLKLLAKTNLPPSLAIEILTGLRLHIHYEIGFGSSYGSLVNNEEFEKRRQLLVTSQKHIYELSSCTIYVTECSFTAVGDYIQPLKAVDELMSLCLNSGYHPAYIIKHLEPGLNYGTTNLTTPTSGRTSPGLSPFLSLRILQIA